MRCVAIIQARLGSARLPGKVLMDIGGKSMLQRVVDRVRECDMVDEAVVACPAGDDIGHIDGASIFKWCGDEADVLGRYAAAAQIYRAGIVVRVTADCPLVDPALIDEQVRAWLAFEEETYVGISKPFPRGAMGEVFGARVLRQANEEATLPYDREHVTPWIKRKRLNRFVYPTDYVPVQAAEGRWCVDEQADLDFVRAVYEHLPDPLAGWREVQAVVDAHGLDRINAHVKQKGEGGVTQ